MFTVYCLLLKDIYRVFLLSENLETFWHPIELKSIMISILLLDKVLLKSTTLINKEKLKVDVLFLFLLDSWQ